MTRTRLIVAAAAAVATAFACAVPAAQAADTCPNAAYRTGAGANLPDCRAWEQVTPVDKQGGRAEARAAYPDASGDRLIYTSNANVSENDDDGRVTGSLFSSVRGSAWTTLGLEPSFDPLPGVAVASPLANAISSDRSKVLAISTREFTADAVEGQSNVYARDVNDLSYSLLASVPGRELGRDAAQGTYFYWGSSNFSTVVITSRLALTPDAPNDGRESLYEIGGGRVSLVSQDDDGVPLELPGQEATPDTVSADGRRVTFRARPFGSGTGPANLYQRVDGTSTVVIARPHRGPDQATPAPVDATAAPFAASPDGTQVTFAAPGAQLTDDGPGPLYQWSANGDTLVSLLAGVATPWGADASVELLHVSANGRYVWVSVTERTDPTNTGRATLNQLAVLDTLAKHVSIKATFADENSEDGFSALTAPEQLRFSPNGTKLVGASLANLTGYNQANNDCRSFLSVPGRCYEAFFFDAEQPEADPVCISCGPLGSRSVGQVDIVSRRSSEDNPPAEAVADTGQAVFGTAQQLVAGDINGLADVYVYTPGRGVSLVTSGAGSAQAGPVAITPSGSDAFFRTADQLLPQDDDVSSDYYDARVNGGLAAQQVRSTDGISCPLGNCPGADSPVPAPRPPGTATFRPAARPAKFEVASLSRSARRSAARSGRVPIVVTVGAPGKLSVHATARVGRKQRTVARASLSVRRAGRFTLRLRLSRDARAALARNRSLAVAVTVSYSQAANAIKRTLVLPAAPARDTTKGRSR